MTAEHAPITCHFSDCAHDATHIHMWHCECGPAPAFMCWGCLIKAEDIPGSDPITLDCGHVVRRALAAWPVYSDNHPKVATWTGPDDVQYHDVAFTESSSGWTASVQAGPQVTFSSTEKNRSAALCGLLSILA